MKRNKYLLPFVLFTAAAVLFTVLTAVIDRAPEGLEGTMIGFSGVNVPVRDAIGFHEGWYMASTWVQRIALVLAAAFGVIGAAQLIVRKDLLRVDAELLALALTYFVTAVVYLLFDKVAINYRPLIPPNETELETSFPSSSSLLAIVIYGTAPFVLKRFLRSGPWLGIVRIVLPAAMVLMVAARMLSGVHWLTDIIGGVLYGAALIALFRFLVPALRRLIRKRHPQEKHRGRMERGKRNNGKAVQ